MKHGRKQMKYTLVTFIIKIFAAIVSAFTALSGLIFPSPEPPVKTPEANTVAAYDVLAADYTLDVDAGNELYDISDLLFGIFFEDINFAADGGLYAEKIVNRSFEFTQIASGDELHGWSRAGKSSGSLITARLAHKLGKKLFVSKLALSGNGGENLFEDVEISIIESAGEILEYLGIEHSGEALKESTVQTESMPEALPDDDRKRRNKILDFLKKDAAFDEEIAGNIGEDPVETGILLTLMEIESSIIRRPDGKYIIND